VIAVPSSGVITPVKLVPKEISLSATATPSDFSVATTTPVL
jgi:hypothetical protein